MIWNDLPPAWMEKKHFTLPRNESTWQIFGIILRYIMTRHNFATWNYIFFSFRSWERKSRLIEEWYFFYIGNMIWKIVFLHLSAWVMVVLVVGRMSRDSLKNRAVIAQDNKLGRSIQFSNYFISANDWRKIKRSSLINPAIKSTIWDFIFAARLSRYLTICSTWLILLAS